MRVLYVDVDSLRPDHLGCYGYDRNTSPTIDALAERGRRFTNYYASDGPCLPSRTALATSRFGIHTGVVNHGGLNADPRRFGSARHFRYPPKFSSFPKVLSQHGMHTAMISPFPSRHDAWQVLEGVDEFHDTGANGNEGADVVASVAKDWLSEHASEDDWFCHVNFWDPHTPYDTPMEYGNPFEDDPAPEWLSDDRIQEQYNSYGPHGAHEPHGVGSDFSEVFDLERTPDEIRDRTDFKQWVDGYDTGIRYMDDHLADVLDVLRDAGVFEDTLIVVSADHGENLGELNVYGDHQTADEYTCNVPFVVSGPGVEPGVDDSFHYQVDMAPTLADLVGADKPAGWDGESFADSIQDGADVGRDYLVISMGAWACQRSVRWDDYLLMRTYHDGFKSSLVEDVQLFDLASDPHETENVAESNPDLVNEGLAKLSRWVDDRLEEAATGENGGNPDAPNATTDPLWNVMQEGGPLHTRGRAEGYAKVLRETGREEHAEFLLENHGQYN